MFFLRLNVVTAALRTVGAVICDFIYSLISLLYQLFMVIARLDVLSSVDVKPIYQRVTMILTIVMTFYITFEFVKYAISPETVTDKEKGVGNILKRIVIVVIMIAFIPNIFEWGFKLQNRIIETQFISKAIIGKTDGDYKSYGGQFSANILSLFYYVDDRDADGACYNDNLPDCALARNRVETKLKRLRNYGIAEIATFINLPSLKSVIKLEVLPAIKFNGIMAIIVGGFIAYILVMYCIDLGTRYFQLLFLQIMAPIAIMGYLLPKKDGIFQKWVKQCITTYIDVFLRIAIMTFVLLLISVLGKAFDSNTIFATIPEGVSLPLKGLTYVALVIGLLAFAQRAPKLLSDLFPSSGNAGLGFGLSAKGRIEPTKKAIQKVTGAGSRVAGGVGGLIAGGKLGQNFGEKIRYGAAGAKAGFDKNNKGFPNRRIERAMAAAEQRKYKEDEIERNAPEGVSRKEAIRQARYHKEQWANKAAEQDRQTKLFDVPGESLDKINSPINEFKHMKAMKQELDTVNADPNKSLSDKRTMDGRNKKAQQVIRQKLMETNGKVTEDMITNGIEITYDELDDAGIKTGNTRTFTYRFVAGDNNFAGVVPNVVKSEFSRMHEAAKELASVSPSYAAHPLEITTMVKDEHGNESEQKISAPITQWLDGRVKVHDDATNTDHWYTFDAEKVYGTNANVFKDAMFIEKDAFQRTKEYQEAHAYKDGIDSGGGKK